MNKFMIGWIVAGILIGINAASFSACFGGSAFVGLGTVIVLMFYGVKPDGIIEFVSGIIYNSFVPLIVSCIVFAFRKF